MGKMTRRLFGATVLVGGTGLYLSKTDPFTLDPNKDVVHANHYTLPPYSDQASPESLVPQLTEGKMPYEVRGQNGNDDIILRNRYDQKVFAEAGNNKIFILNPDFGTKRVQGIPDSLKSEKLGNKGVREFRSLIRGMTGAKTDVTGHYNELYLGRDVLFAFDKYEVKREGDNLEIRLFHNGDPAKNDKPYESKLILEDQFAEPGKAAIQKFGVLDERGQVSLHNESLGAVKQWEEFLQKAFVDSYQRKQLASLKSRSAPDANSPSTPNPRDPKVVYEEAMKRYKSKLPAASGEVTTAAAESPAAPTAQQIAAKEAYDEVTVAVAAYNDEPKLVLENFRKANANEGPKKFVKPGESGKPSAAL